MMKRKVATDTLVQLTPFSRNQKRRRTCCFLVNGFDFFLLGVKISRRVVCMYNAHTHTSDSFALALKGFLLCPPSLVRPTDRSAISGNVCSVPLSGRIYLSAPLHCHRPACCTLNCIHMKHTVLLLWYNIVFASPNSRDCNNSRLEKKIRVTIFLFIQCKELRRKYNTMWQCMQHNKVELTDADGSETRPLLLPSFAPTN